MRKVACVLISFVAVGCAFKEDAISAGGSTGNDPRYSIAFDWGNEQVHRSPLLKARRSLALSPDHAGFSTELPVTVEQTPSASLSIALQVPPSQFAEAPKFVRASVIVENTVYTLPVQMLDLSMTPENTRRMGLRLDGIASVLPSDKAARASVEIEFFNGLNRTNVLSFTLRTPPRNVRVEAVALRDWIRGVSNVEATLRMIRVANSRLNLVRVLRLKNDEDVDVDVSIARRPSAAAVSQDTTEFSYQDTGCAGTGFSINQRKHHESLSSLVVLLPMNSDLISLAVEALKDRAKDTSLTVRVPANGELALGYYAVGRGADGWMDRGASPSILYQRSVPGTCSRVCREQECHRPGLRLAEGPKGGCYCVSHETVRASASITLGTAQGPVLLNMPEDSTRAVIRYADLDSQIDPEASLLKFMDASSEIAWFR